jgi:hypothetical protein
VVDGQCPALLGACVTRPRCAYIRGKCARRQCARPGWRTERAAFGCLRRSVGTGARRWQRHVGVGRGSVVSFSASASWVQPVIA